MHTLFTALTALMVFATSGVAGEIEDAGFAYEADDYEKAFWLWKPLAEQGHASAQFNIGRMYDIGEGVAENDAKAV